MRTTIREKVFETNSSATHSLVVVGGHEADREYLRLTAGEDGVSKYDSLFPKENDWYEPQETLDALINLGASWNPKTKELDLTTIPPETYDIFGYPDVEDIGYKVDPGIKFLLVVAMRDSLAGNPYYYTSEWDEESVLSRLSKYVGAKTLKIPEGLDGVNHQCSDEIRYSILSIGVIDVVRRKDVILSIDHD